MGNEYMMNKGDEQGREAIMQLKLGLKSYKKPPTM